jgi:hypothetical protein
LEAFLTKFPQAEWSEFVQAVHARFMRNQHQVLLRRLYRIAQTDSVEDYVQRFSDLVDQVSVYDSNPDPLNYLTRFLDGLKPGVRVLVAIQQPEDLDTAYTMALLYEELGDGCTPWNSPPQAVVADRRSFTSQSQVQPPPLPAKWISKTVADRKLIEHSRGLTEDKWTNLRNYRRAKGLCFTCGKKWSKEHQCKNAIQLHVVHEMIDFMQSVNEATDSEAADDAEPGLHLFQLSLAAAALAQPTTKSMQFLV